ncbi:MAG: glycine zipper 2TM domain-containing protein [Pseudomonadales bacterium]|nr:glycine zipper 2TM domain-containing protein [Pseudomonadales bacterium]
MKSLLGLVLSAALFIAGCASSLEGDTYQRNDALTSMQVQEGTVIAVKPVVIEGSRSVAGQAAGAVIGGVSGHAVGGGSGQNLATAVGAVAGSVLGQMTEERLTRAQGLELLVRLNNGETIAVIQESDDLNAFFVGDAVRVISGNGKVRVSR